MLQNVLSEYQRYTTPTPLRTKPIAPPTYHLPLSLFSPSPGLKLTTSKHVLPSL